jgi:hypothetical protein
MKRVIVIGLAFRLQHREGASRERLRVIAVDKNKDAVQRIRDYATKPCSPMGQTGYHGNDRDPGIIGDRLLRRRPGRSTLNTLHLKQLGGRTSSTRAGSEDHKLILNAWPTGHHPGKGLGAKLARSLVNRTSWITLPFRTIT